MGGGWKPPAMLRECRGSLQRGASHQAMLRSCCGRPSSRRHEMAMASHIGTDLLLRLPFTRPPSPLNCCQSHPHSSPPLEPLRHPSSHPSRANAGDAAHTRWGLLALYHCALTADAAALRQCSRLPAPLLPTPAHKCAPYARGRASAAVRPAAAFTRARPAARPLRAAAPRPVCMASGMQFIKGIDEPTIPDVKLTRSRDGASGTGESVRVERSDRALSRRGGLVPEPPAILI